MGDRAIAGPYRISGNSQAGRSSVVLIGGAVSGDALVVGTDTESVTF
jgi:hypothetical protein